jgi:hypothetical protein
MTRLTFTMINAVATAPSTDIATAPSTDIGSAAFSRLGEERSRARIS